MKLIYKWFIGIMVAAVVIVGGIVASNHYEIKRIATGSMRPQLPIGSLVIVHKTHSDFAKGDIISFHETDGQIVSHRFIGIDKKTHGIMTKGDANLTPDVHYAPIRNQDVVGRVVVSTNLFAPTFWRSLRGGIVAGSLLVLGWVLFSKNEEDASETENEGEKESDEEDQLAGTTPV